MWLPTWVTTYAQPYTSARSSAAMSASRDFFWKVGFGLARLIRYMACDMAGRTSSSCRDLLNMAVAWASTGADRQALGLPVKIWTVPSCSALIVSTALSRPRPVWMCIPIRRSLAIVLIVGNFPPPLAGPVGPRERRFSAGRAFETSGRAGWGPVDSSRVQAHELLGGPLRQQRLPAQRSEEQGGPVDRRCQRRAAHHQRARGTAGHSHLDHPWTRRPCPGAATGARADPRPLQLSRGG